jgi:hypothetical protein
VVQQWKKAVPGTDEDKSAAVAELSRIWKSRTGCHVIVGYFDYYSVLGTSTSYRQ